jgi:hypothetical protein
MGVTSVFSCEVCGRVKGISNHWWLGLTAQLGDGNQMASISRWNESLARMRSTHLCGQKCAMVWIARMMDAIAAQGLIQLVH